MLKMFGCWVLGTMWALAAMSGEPVALVSGNDYAPFAGSKLVEGGLATDVVTRALAAAGMDAMVAWQPWAGGYAQTLAGNYAGTFPYTRTPEREADMLFSAPLVALKERVFVKNTPSKFDYSTLAGFAGSTICISAGTPPHPKLATLVRSGQIKRLAPMDTSVCVRLVESGEADFFVLEEFAGRAALAASGLPAGSLIVAPVAPLSERELFLVAPKKAPGSAQLIAALNQGLVQLRKSGVYDQVLAVHTK